MKKTNFDRYLAHPSSFILHPSSFFKLSVANLLAGQPSTESQASFKKWLATRNAHGHSPPASTG